MNKGNVIFYGRFFKENPHKEELLQLQSIIKTRSNQLGGRIIEQKSSDCSIEFSEVEQAIKFALDYSRGNYKNPALNLRFGISLDHKMTSSNESLAYHLSGIAARNSILISKDIAQCISSDLVQHTKAGHFLFKGFQEETEIFALTDAHLYTPSVAEFNATPKPKKSIAVLPFLNSSSNEELKYICEGLAEEVIDKLTRTKGLFIIARSSSFIFKNREIPISDIGVKLNVNYILDGSIRQRKDQYRISFQLVDCASGYNVISDSIDAPMNQLYDCESSISEDILRYFEMDKISDEKEIEKKHKPKKEENYYIDPEAYAYYLKGKYYSYQWQIEPVQKAIQYYEKALEIVEDYALAYAGLSMAYTHIAISRFADYKESMTKANAYADKAIAADSKLADAYMSKAITTFWLGNWYVSEFDMNITKALALSPCNAEIRMFNGMLFLMKGELRRSLSELMLAKQLDPYSQGTNIRLGLVQYLNKQYEEAFNTFVYLLNTHQNKTYNVLRIAWCCIQLKQYHKAIEYLEKSDKDYEYYNMINGTYLVIYHGLKDESKFFKYKEMIETEPDESSCALYNKAVLYKLLGKKSLSIAYLGYLLKNPMFLLTFMQYDEFYSDLHEEAEFKALMEEKYKGSGNQMIKIQSDTKEFIEFKFKDFIYAEAQDNYTSIVFRKDDQIIEKTIRGTLAHIENQLAYQEIYRCHRSYIINLAADFNMSKKDNKILISHTELSNPIPVSRSKEKEVKEFLMQKSV